MKNINISSTDKETALALAAHIKSAIKGKPRFNLAVSGGSTPKLLFQTLAREYGSQIDWSKVYIYWVDERCVAPDNKQSNYKMTKEALLDQIQVPPTNVNRVLGEMDPRREAARYANLLEIDLDRNDQGVPVFDLVILGLGTDGHTASIFPHQIGLWHANDHCIVGTHPDSGQKRVSLNGAVINAAKEVIFHITGDAKSEMVQKLIKENDNHQHLPAALVKPKNGQLIWYLDQAAAGLLS